MEYRQSPMTDREKTQEIFGSIGESDMEAASNSYLMSVVTVIVGMPLPIINLITTLVFLFANKSRGYFVRWHCMQALMTQVLLFFMNMAGVIWTLILIFSANSQFSNTYAAYIVVVILSNIVEFIATVYAAVRVRKGIHVEWWFFGNLTSMIVKK
ncbi:MAG: DUF4870 domain-containing protein [Bacteroidota bacterium]